MLVYLCITYRNFEHFIKHKPLISVECLFFLVYVLLFGHGDEREREKKVLFFLLIYLVTNQYLPSRKVILQSFREEHIHISIITSVL